MLMMSQLRRVPGVESKRQLANTHDAGLHDPKVERTGT